MKRAPVRIRALLPRVFFLAAMVSATAAGRAVEWEKIVDGNGRAVEIDSEGIFSSDHGTKVSWGRIVLSDEEAARAGYRTVKTLNRYDCLNRSFATIKRVYLDGHDNVAREETPPEQTPRMVRRNSVDERIWRKVCGLTGAEAPADRTIRNAGGAAEKIDRIAAAAERAVQSTITGTARGARVAAAAPHATPAPARVSSAPPGSGVRPPPPVAPVDKAPSAPAAATPEPAPPATGPMPPVARNAAPAAPATAPASTPPRPAMHRAATARRMPEPIVFPAARSMRQAAASRTPPAPPAARRAPKGAEWDYSGAHGPESWGRLRPEWKTCGEGMRQSPIDFAASAPLAVNLDAVKFNYRPARFRITDTGKQLRIEVENPGRDMSMEVRGRRYALEGFTLHRPSEARLGGQVADMSVHFYHRDGEGRIAALAVQAQRGDAPNTLLQALLNNLPLERGGNGGYMPGTMIDLDAFLPKNPAHFLYMGSLSTPPCSEGVLWVVMKEPVTLSDEQFALFARLHARNARPPQPANGRMVLESR